LEGSGRGLILKYYPGIRLELKKTTKSSKASWSPGRDLNTDLPNKKQDGPIRRQLLGTSTGDIIAPYRPVRPVCMDLKNISSTTLSLNSEVFSDYMHVNRLSSD
jgi:hypothetical protein